MPCAARTHRRDERLERCREPDDVGAQDAIEDRDVLRLGAGGADRDARIRDDDVGHAVACDEVLGRRAHRARIGDIGRVRRARDAERTREIVEEVLAPCHQPEYRTLARVVRRERGADPARGAGDEDRSGDGGAYFFAAAAVSLRACSISGVRGVEHPLRAALRR